MDKKIIICVSGGMIQTIRSNFKSDKIDIEIWDEDSEEYLREQFGIDENQSIDSFWENEIVTEYKNVMY